MQGRILHKIDRGSATAILRGIMVGSLITTLEGGAGHPRGQESEPHV